jgi:hypothetical protein
MTPLEALRAELEDLSRVLEATAGSGTEPWSPEWMAKQSLLRRQADLAHQISLMEGTAEVEVRLAGGAEQRNEVPADFLGGFLQAFQGAVASIVQSLLHGETERGQLPADVLSASRLRVGAAAPGSFIVQMTGPVERNIQMGIDTTEGPPPFDEAVDRVLEVLQAAEGDVDIERLQSAIVEIGSPRAVGHVTEMARALARTGTTAMLTERSPFRGEPREARVSSLAANRLHEVLSRTKQDTTTVFMTGQLSGLRWTKGIFDLEVEIGEETVVISGRVTADLRASASARFDQVVRAELV